VNAPMLKRSPSTLIWPPAGASNSTVPRRCTVAGKRTGSSNAVWPPASSAIRN
jgi:hypothetical protein